MYSRYLKLSKIHKTLIAMRLFVKVLYWIGIVILWAVLISTVNAQESVPLIPDIAPETSLINEDFLVKTGITILILIVGYLASLGINNIIKRIESNSKAHDALLKAVNGFTLELKLQRQKNSQYEKDLAIHNRRINRLDNKVNHQDIEITKLKEKWKH